jgi:hypothetical protein
MFDEGRRRETELSEGEAAEKEYDDHNLLDPNPYDMTFHTETVAVVFMAINRYL